MIKPSDPPRNRSRTRPIERLSHSVASSQTISASQAEREFQENHKRLKADRMRCEAKAKKRADDPPDERVS
jgi:hypothetical protein